MYNPLANWIRKFLADIRERGFRAVVGAAVIALVYGVAKHWFYGKILAFVESLHAPNSVRLLVVRSLTSPVSVALIALIVLIGALAVHAYFRDEETGLWLEYDATQAYNSRPLRVQNSGEKIVYDVVVKILDFASDPIPRVVNDGSWVVCTSSGETETHNKMIERIVGSMLVGELEAPTKRIPVFISFRYGMLSYGKQKLEVKMPLTHGIKFSLPEELKNG